MPQLSQQDGKKSRPRAYIENPQFLQRQLAQPFLQNACPGGSTGACQFLDPCPAELTAARIPVAFNRPGKFPVIVLHLFP